MYLKNQTDPQRITQNILKSQILDLFTKSPSGHKQKLNLETHHYTSYIIRKM